MSNLPNEQIIPETATPPGEVETPETPSAEEVAEAAAKAAEEAEAEKPALSLEDAIAEVTKTRGEAANYRTRAQAAEKKLAEAKTLEEVNEIVANMTADRVTAERALLVENVALKYDLPEALAGRLVGATREELEADAQALAALAGTTEAPAPRLKGGLTPNVESDGDPSDPGALARKYAPRR